MTAPAAANPAPFVIVVAEDNSLIRMAAIETLLRKGFLAVEAEHAAAALAMLHLRAADIHVLFTDIGMPGEMDGLALAHHTRKTWPWIALLITSGTVPLPAGLPAGCRFLPKPYDPNHMIAHVRELAVAA